MAAPKCQNCGESQWSEDDGRCKLCRHFLTLGHQVGEWIESHCAVPDRDEVGEPFLLTEWQWTFLLNYYKINPFTVHDGKRWVNPFHYTRGGQLTAQQKYGKGPFAGSMICGEAAGPALFDGWDEAGEPVGRPWPTPIVQIAASSKDQTENVWMTVLPMIALGDFDKEIPDTGLTRIYLPGGGWIEPVASNARSRLGQRITFLVQDRKSVV